MDDSSNDNFLDLDGFGELEEAPEAFLSDAEVLPFDDAGGGGGGISRTFRIVFGLVVVAVVVIVVFIVILALGSGDDLSPSEKTATSIAGTNVAVQTEYARTVEALQIAEAATQQRLREIEMTATQESIIAQTQAAIEATNVASTATAEFLAAQTQAAAQTATQEAIFATQTKVAQDNVLTGQVINEEGTVFGNVTLRLYRDDGDGVFNPATDAQPTPAPGGATPASDETTGPEQAIRYGESAQGTLAAGEKANWVFTGTTGDLITIDAIAADPTQTDMFLALLGPDGSLLIGDDDSGEAPNARISNFALLQGGQYTIQVSSSTGPGDYTLTLGLGLPEGGPESPAVTPEPTLAGSARNTGIVLVSASRGGPSVRVMQGTPIPGDELIEAIITATDGTFDFGTLEPGIYWLELEYDSLPPNLQALVPPGVSLVIQVNVPAGGDVTFEVGAQPTPVPTVPGLSSIDMTSTARASLITPSP
ncbi:MAG: PPC domain-containing protein, partial [Chloroflexi bacterium]|nr:PPC domain-containing protein [Chloroflexota bacterium]